MVAKRDNEPHVGLWASGHAIALRLNKRDIDNLNDILSHLVHADDFVGRISMNNAVRWAIQRAARQIQPPIKEYPSA
jgi:hypothetical protein